MGRVEINGHYTARSNKKCDLTTVAVFTLRTFDARGYNKGLQRLKYDRE